MASSWFTELLVDSAEAVWLIAKKEKVKRRSVIRDFIDFIGNFFWMGLNKIISGNYCLASVKLDNGGATTGTFNDGHK